MNQDLIQGASDDAVPVSGHPGTEAPSFEVMAWIARITERWRASVESIIETGRLLNRAKESLPRGSWGEVLSGLPFGERQVQMLMAIASDVRLSNPQYVALLPASWGTIYDLTRLDDGELARGFREQIIRPDMERKDIELIRPARAATPRIAQPMSNEEVLGSSSAVEPDAVNVLVAGSSPASPASSEPASMPGGGLAIAHRRVEDADSLDFFPTPPWATRAFFEHVLPRLGRKSHCEYQVAWEPACGKGHMAEVMREYFKEVHATDIIDYDKGYFVQDFLNDPNEANQQCFDWIITNPPFNDSADFVLKALKLAGTGVAMFVRLAWLESVGRYEKIFSRFPPTLLSIFSERVPLHKGVWKDDGSTMTAYIWLTWIKGAQPSAPFWIPPGCREALMKPDDVKRFGKRVVEGEAA
jgi:hypothetical protein